MSTEALEFAEADTAPRPIAPSRNGRKLAEAVAFILILVAGVSIRMLDLDSGPFMVDEAESSINALTILQHGYPTDSYLGIPIYENTHVWFWPENPEYEFRDVSYSENHFAVYHGWLPLYAIAASFALHGVRPDQDDGTRVTKHNLAEQKRRTRAARLPAVVFAAMFLIIVFLGGNALYGRRAGWAALIVGAIYPYHLQISDQARYYSAEVTLTTACCVLLWLVIKECRWKYVYLAAAAFVLLFHTHLLSFFTAAVMAALSMPVIVRRHGDWLRKMSVFAAVVAAGTLPWVFATGFYRHQNRIPRAWPLLQIPSDLLRYPPVRIWSAVAGLVSLIVVLCVYLSRRRLSREVSAPAMRAIPALLFLSGWALVGYATFLLGIPAVSFTIARLNLSYWGPLFLLGSILCAALTDMLAPGAWWPLAPLSTSLLMLLIFFATGHSLEFGHRAAGHTWGAYEDIFRQLDSLRLDSATRLYASPNSQFVLSFYSGMPVQDITPVRKSYLDSYRGDIVHIDPEIAVATGILDTERVQEAARRSGYTLSTDSAEETSLRLRTRPYRESIMDVLAPGQPSHIEPLPEFALGLLAAHRARVTAQFENSGYELVTRGYQIRDWSDWCVVLKYRFVDPQARRGIHANYVDRLRGADAMIVGRSEPVAIYHSRWHPPHSTESLAFRFVR